jgi:TetR/AcrR family transcriptional repressor of nem operon
MGAGRPKSFDENEVIERAMHVFWREGYEGASLSDLLREMGISRQSLYDTFHNKRELFIRTIEHYRNTQLSAALLLLERDLPPVENVKDVILFFEKLALDASGRGCFIANTLVELGSKDPEIAALLAETLEFLRSAVEAALRTAQERGDLSRAKSPIHLSRALTNAMVGLAVMGRLPTEPSEVHEVYSGTLSMLD